MNEQNRERVSAFMDDELSPEQIRRLLEGSKNDNELRQFWQSGHIISAAMRGELLAVDESDLASRVRDALVSEPLLLAPAVVRKHRILGPVGGLALAASVSIVAIIMTQQALLSPQTPAPKTVASSSALERPRQAQSAGVTVASDQTPAAPQTLQAAASTDNTALTRLTWNEAVPAVEERLNNYLLNHNVYMAGGLHGMLPYARVVGYGQTK